MTKQWITRSGTFDSGHRVMNERFKCFNTHGHTYLFDLNFEFDAMEQIGFTIDFKEIKRVGLQWIDDIIDHGMILNPHDKELLEVVLKLNGKTWLMSLNGEGEFCNPTVENIAKEIFLAIEILFQQYPALKLYSIKMYETPNCFTICTTESISEQERQNWRKVREKEVNLYAKRKGVLEYDSTKVQIEESVAPKFLEEGD